MLSATSLPGKPASGFGKLFIQLHYLLFSEADWVFPANSILTALYPPQLFLHGMLAWLLMMVVISLLLALLARRFTSPATTLQ